MIDARQAANYGCAVETKMTRDRSSVENNVAHKLDFSKVDALTESDVIEASALGEHSALKFDTSRERRAVEHRRATEHRTVKPRPSKEPGVTECCILLE